MHGQWQHLFRGGKGREQDRDGQCRIELCLLMGYDVEDVIWFGNRRSLSVCPVLYIGVAMVRPWTNGTNDFPCDRKTSGETADDKSWFKQVFF